MLFDSSLVPWLSLGFKFVQVFTRCVQRLGDLDVIVKGLRLHLVKVVAFDAPPFRPLHPTVEGCMLLLLLVLHPLILQSTVTCVMNNFSYLVFRTIVERTSLFLCVILSDIRQFVLIEDAEHGGKNACYLLRRTFFFFKHPCHGDILGPLHENLKLLHKTFLILTAHFPNLLFNFAEGHFL